MRGRRRHTAVLLFGSALAFSCGKSGSEPPTPAEDVASEDEKILYTLGLYLGRDVTVFHLSPDELRVVYRGLVDGATNQDARFPLEVYGPKVTEMASRRNTAALQKEKARAQAFVEKEAAVAGTEKTASGLLFRELKAGTGARPTATSTVTVRFEGRLADGAVFDQAPDSVDVRLDNIVPCWIEGLQKMAVGGKAHLVCPPDLGYGDRGNLPKVPGGAALAYEIELLGVR